MRRVILFATALVGSFALAGCSAPKGEVERVLADQGYTDVRVGGHDLFRCGRDDSTSNKFTAKGPTGRPVRGVVCGTAGWSKGYTVRTY